MDSLDDQMTCTRMKPSMRRAAPPSKLLDCELSVAGTHGWLTWGARSGLAQAWRASLKFVVGLRGRER